MVGNHLDQRFLILVTNAAFSTRHCPRQRKIRSRFVVAHSTKTYLYCHKYAFTRFCRSHSVTACCSERETVVPSVTTTSTFPMRLSRILSMTLPRTPCSRKIASIQQPLAVRFDQEHIAVTRGMVDTEWRDLEYHRSKTACREKRFEWFLMRLQSASFFCPPRSADRRMMSFCQRTGINGNLRSIRNICPV